MSKLAPLEIRALVKIMDELDYYQILHLERDSDAGSVKRAFYATSRAFHPDTNRHLDEDLLASCGRICKRVTEAYSVLRNPHRRATYDQKLTEQAGLRLQLAEAKQAQKQAQKTQQALGATTEQGRQFYQKVVDDQRRGDLPSAARNLQMALTFEPGNQGFKDLLDELKKSIKEAGREAKE